jgi:ectoine hydroxylase-related dioxygenase (phytanoyl-CoA dioxygenase family)
MLVVSAEGSRNWLAKTQEALRYEGCAVVTDVMGAELMARTRRAMYEVRRRIHEDVGADRLARAGESGVLRLMLRYDPVFFELLCLPAVLDVVDCTIAETAILHLQNGFILPPRDATEHTSFQRTFHRDLPRYLNGYLASINVMLALDPFTAENGGTLVVAGTHQRPARPEDAYMTAAVAAIECPAGAAIVFDSTLWHAAGANLSAHDRLAVNHQFTRSFFKQQIDYVRALGDDVVLAQPPRVQQLLGWYTRVVTSLDEYYRPADERLYRAGQG